MNLSTCNGTLMTWAFANVKQSQLRFLSTDAEKDMGNAATTWLCKYR